MEKNKEIKQFIQEELIKLHRKTLLENTKKRIEEELKILNESEDRQIVELTFLRVDDNTGNFFYKGSDGNIYVSIEGAIHSVTDEREPNYPVHNTIIKQGEPIYNPEDRFGRNPGSKLQTETKDIKAMYTRAGMDPPHPGKGIHTKKFHKCVTSVGDEKGKNPYAICMASLGADKAVKASHRKDEQINEENTTPKIIYIAMSPYHNPSKAFFDKNAAYDYINSRFRGDERATAIEIELI